MTVSLIDVVGFGRRSRVRISSCPDIIPERLKAHYFNERHDIVSFGVIQPCEESKQLCYQQTASHICQIRPDYRLCEHFTLDLDFAFSCFHRRHFSSAVLDYKGNKQSLSWFICNWNN